MTNTTPTPIELAQLYKVFVYGSLKCGFGNHSFLENSDFLGTTCTKDTNFMMFSFGQFPAVVKSDEQGYGSIEGELYLVDAVTLFKLDMLESNGTFYTREVVDLDNDEKAWMYILNNYSKHMSDDDDQIKLEYQDDKLVFSWAETSRNNIIDYFNSASASLIEEENYLEELARLEAEYDNCEANDDLVEREHESS